MITAGGYHGERPVGAAVRLLTWWATRWRRHRGTRSGDSSRQIPAAAESWVESWVTGCGVARVAGRRIRRSVSGHRGRVEVGCRARSRWRRGAPPGACAGRCPSGSSRAEDRGVLVRAALASRARVKEVDRRAERLCDPDVACHLGSLVPGDRSPQRRWQIAKASTERVVERVGIALG